MVSLFNIVLLLLVLLLRVCMLFIKQIILTTTNKTRLHMSFTSSKLSRRFPNSTRTTINFDVRDLGELMTVQKFYSNSEFGRWFVFLPDKTSWVKMPIGKMKTMSIKKIPLNYQMQNFKSEMQRRHLRPPTAKLN